MRARAHQFRCTAKVPPAERGSSSAPCARGASLKATEQPIDTSTAAGKCFLDMLGVFAEFETNLRRERQLAKAKMAGVYKGRPASIDATQVRAMKGQGFWGRLGDREGPQDRPGVGLSGVGSACDAPRTRRGDGRLRQCGVRRITTKMAADVMTHPILTAALDDTRSRQLGNRRGFP
jgi:hypothetical protein